MPRQFAPYFEIPIASDPVELVDAIRRDRGFAKARTGGVTEGMFPDAKDVARFMIRCRDARVAFKLTAGLHHPMRAEYALTYDSDAPRGTMFGYLNMFTAAVLAWDGADESVVLSALLSQSPRDFHFSDDAVAFHSTSVPIAVVRDAREKFIISFGSCSFREPVDDLAAISIS